MGIHGRFVISLHVNKTGLISIRELKSLFGRKGRYNVLFSNITWQALESGTRMLAGIFTGILLASYLGPGPLGIYSYSLSFIMLFSPLMSLGYDGFLVRDIIFQKEKWADILGSSAVLKAAGSLVSIAIIYIITSLDSSLDTETKSIVLVLSLSFLFNPFDVFDIWFKARLKSRIASISKIIALLLVNVLKVWFIWNKAPLVDFAWLYVAEFVVNGILQLFFYLRTEPQSLKKWTVSPQRLRFVVSESWPLLVSAFSYMIYNRIDQVMIGRMLDNESVGIFSAAGKISDLPVALILVLNSSIYPFMARNFKDRRGQFLNQYKLITDFYTVISYLMLVIVVFAAGLILQIYPASFASGKMVLIINFIGLVFVFNSGLRNSYLSLTGMQKYLLYITILSAVFNIVLNLFLIPLYGINGAAWASAITEFLALFVLNGVFKGTRPIFKIQAREFLLISLFRLPSRSKN
jgi:polysaccharide transporter, PST family